MITHDPEIESRLSRKVLISDGEIIDPALANALSFLPHPALLKCNSGLTRRVFQSGETLDLNGVLSDQLILVETGQLALNLQVKNQPGQSLQLHAGNFLGGRHVIHHEKLPEIKARVTGQPVQAALLPFSTLWAAQGHQSDTQAVLLRQFCAS